LILIMDVFVIWGSLQIFSSLGRTVMQSSV